MGGFVIGENDSLATYYPDGTYIDYSSVGNDGTKSNITTVADPTGVRAGSFNGTSSQVSLGDINFTNMTLGGWYYINADANQYIFSKYSATKEFRIYYSLTNGLRCLAYSNNTTVAADISAYGEPFSDVGVWAHIMLVMDDTNNLFTLYYNGEPTSTTLTGSVQNGSNNILIGNADPSLWFGGKSSDFAVWTRALPAEEIKNIYQKTYRS